MEIEMSLECQTETWKWLTVAVATTACIVSLMQWRLARTRLRLDLYDRRFKVFDALKTFLVSAVTGNSSPEPYKSMVRETAAAEFLFPPEVQEYAETVRQKALELLVAIRRMENPNYPGYQQDVDAQFAINVWFGEQLTTGALENVFKPYLDFRNVP